MQNMTPEQRAYNDAACKMKLTFLEAYFLQDEFDRVWYSLLKAGRCDELYSLAYWRLLMQWMTGGKEDALVDFIDQGSQSAFPP